MAYARLEGHFAFVAVHADQPGLVVGARNRCPLLVGVGDGEMFLASSISAFAGDTRRVMLVEDDEIVAITADGVRLVGADGEPREREEIVIAWDEAAAERGGYETYMLKEIYEQPQAVGETLARNLRPDAARGLRGWRWRPWATATSPASGAS